jgi:selenocysteine-specific elongation factor
VIDNLRARDEGTAQEIIMALLEAKQPFELSALISQSNLSVDDAGQALEDLIEDGQITRIGEGKNSLLLTSNGWNRFVDKVLSILNEYHQKYPVRSGIPKIELGSRLKMGNYGMAALENLISQGIILEEGGHVRLSSHTIKLTPIQQLKIDTFLKSLDKNPYSPPGDFIPEADLVNMLVEQGTVVKVSDGIIYASSAYNKMVAEIKSYIESSGKVTLGQVRDMFGTSRKYAQALLEFLDRQKVTRRVGDDRVLY